MKMKLLALLGISAFGVLNANTNSTQQTPKKQYYFSDNQTVSVTPPAGPRVAPRDWTATITADFIYWTVRQDGMFHAVSGVGANVAKGKVHDLDWSWDAGFKVGLGFGLPHDGWDVYAEYNWIQSSASDTTTSSNLVSYWSINGSPGLLASLSRSHAKWDIKFHDLHLELGRNSYISQYFKVRIHAGLRAAWIDQEYRLTQTVAVSEDINRLRIDQDFWGLGLQAGLNNAWQFTSNFSFFADFALSILWGQFDLDRKDSSTNSNNVKTTNINTGVKPHTFEPVLNIAAGLRWETWFSNDYYHIALQAGWEHQLWILQNEYIKVPTETDHIGDLVLQGLTIRGRFDF